MSHPHKATTTTEVRNVLEPLFNAVIEEAAGNPEFADRLRAALDSPTPQKPIAKKTTAKTATDTFDPASCHAVNILRQHGEKMLRGRLSSLRSKAQLTQVAKRSGLRLTGKAAQKTATRADIIEGIVTAAILYDQQRQSADG